MPVTPPFHDPEVGVVHTPLTVEGHDLVGSERDLCDIADLGVQGLERADLVVGDIQHTQVREVLGRRDEAMEDRMAARKDPLTTRLSISSRELKLRSSRSREGSKRWDREREGEREEGGREGGGGGREGERQGGREEQQLLWQCLPPLLSSTYLTPSLLISWTNYLTPHPLTMLSSMLLRLQSLKTACLRAVHWGAPERSGAEGTGERGLSSASSPSSSSSGCTTKMSWGGGREGGREGGRKGGREGGREEGREGGREGQRGGQMQV